MSHNLYLEAYQLYFVLDMKKGIFALLKTGFFFLIASFLKTKAVHREPNISQSSGFNSLPFESMEPLELILLEEHRRAETDGILYSASYAHCMERSVNFLPPEL